MSKQQNKKKNTGALILMFCGAIAVALIIGCVFFSEELFGLFLK